MSVSKAPLSWLKIAFLLVVLAAASLPSWAQGCALCYTQAAGAGARMIQALRSGILILIFPPMAICIGLTYISYKKRNLCRSTDEASSESDLGW
jgi:hypothetical protein